MTELNEWHAPELVVVIVYVIPFVQGSWSVAIATRLKNMCRQPRAKGVGLEFEPPTKLVKRSGNHSSELNTILPFLDAMFPLADGQH